MNTVGVSIALKSSGAPKYSQMLRTCFLALAFSFSLFKQKYYQPYVYMHTIISFSYISALPCIISQT